MGTSYTGNMFSLRLALCVCVFLFIGIEAALKPKPEPKPEPKPAPKPGPQWWRPGYPVYGYPSYGYPNFGRPGGIEWGQGASNSHAPGEPIFRLANGWKMQEKNFFLLIVCFAHVVC